MHRVATELVQAIRIGIGTDELFVRIDGPALLKGLAASQFGLALVVGSGKPSRLELVPAGSDVRVALGDVVEAAANLQSVGAEAGTRLSLSLLITDAAGHVIEQHPPGTPIIVEIPAEDVEAVNWTV